PAAAAGRGGDRRTRGGRTRSAWRRAHRPPRGRRGSPGASAASGSRPGCAPRRARCAGVARGQPGVRRNAARAGQVSARQWRAPGRQQHGKMMTERDAKLTLALTLSLLLAACATTHGDRQAQPQPPAAPATATDSGAAINVTAPEKPPEPKLYKGSGILVHGQAEGGDVPPTPRPPPPTGPAVTLNFEGADIRD